MSLQLDPSFSGKIPGKLSELDDIKIAIVGDVGLDEYIVGEVKKISPEAPVPVVEVTSESAKLGLSCNVAANVVSMGGQVELIGLVGQDRASDQISSLLAEHGVGTSSLIVDESRPTTRKTRIMAEHQQVVRVDHEKKKFIGADLEDRLLEELPIKLKGCQGVILEDYAKGMLSEKVCQGVIEQAKKMQIPVLVDPSRTTPVSYYRGASLIKPNRDEAILLTGFPLEEIHRESDFMEKVGFSLMQQAHAENVVITEGKQGMKLFSGKQWVQLPTFARDVFDVTGAGDTVIATMALAWCAGWSLPEACILANHAAGYVVSQLGCVTCHRNNLLEELKVQSLTH